MCVSAEVSFGLSAVLFPAGAYCVRSALRKKRKLLGLAIIPLVFSVQQFSEGVVWNGLNRDNLDAAQYASFVFLYVALAFWPFWVPTCAFLSEPNSWRKWVSGGIALLGLAEGLMLYLPVVLNPEVLVLRVRHHSIFYDVTQSAAFEVMPKIGWQLLYAAIVGIPMLIAPKQGFLLLGIALVAAAVVSQVFFWYAFTSVWCFLAAILSLYLCISFRQLPAVSQLDASRAGAAEGKV